jgi:drug/metabolite transporter (DMT)-like permease
VKNHVWFYHAIAFIVVAIWGSTFIFTKLLLLNGLTPAQIFTLRFLIAYVLLAGFEFLFRRHSHRWVANTLVDELIMLVLGITGGSLYFLTENEALNYTTTTNVSLIVCSCPLVAAMLISFFYKSQRMRPMQVVGTLMAVCGVATVVLNGHFVLRLSPRGDALALAANLCWAIYSLMMIPANRLYSSLFVTRKVFFYGLFTMIPYYLLKPAELPTVLGGEFDLGVLLHTDVLSHLLFLGVIASCVCFLVWTWVMDRLGAMIATNYVYVNPVSTIVFASVILGEQITPFFLLGTVLILAGMYLAARVRA